MVRTRKQVAEDNGSSAGNSDDKVVSKVGRSRRLSFTGAIMSGIEEDKGALKTQVYALLLAGSLFYIFYQALYVSLAIFSAYKEPVMWAFLCSVPINALKDQLKKSLLDDGAKRNEEDDEEQDSFGSTFLRFSRLRYCLFATVGIFMFSMIGKHNLMIFLFIFIAILGIFLLLWIILYLTSWIIQKLSPSNHILAQLPSDPIVFSLNIFSYVFYPLKCCFRTVLSSNYIKSRMASLLLFCILMITFCIGAFVCVFAIPLEMYGLLQNVQGKLVQYVPEINSEVLAQPVLSFGYLNSNTVMHPDDSEQLISLRKFLRRKKEGGNVILKDIDATQITITWKFEDDYVVDNVEVEPCLENYLNDGQNKSHSNWVWKSQGLVNDEEDEDEGKWIEMKNNTMPGTYAGIRINFNKNVINSDKNNDTMMEVCLNKIIIHGKMDLLKYVEKATKDHPIVVRLREVKTLMINQQGRTLRSDVSNNICSDYHIASDFDKDITWKMKDRSCIMTPAYQLRRDCMPVIKEGCANVTRNLIAFTNLSSINMCYGQIKNCTKSCFNYLHNVTKSTMDIDIDVIYEQGRTILEASFGKALTFVSVIFDTVYFFFMWMLDSFVFWNVLYVLTKASEDPVKWILKAFMTNEDNLPLIECVSDISRSYINGVFQTLLRIVLENALLTWLPMYLTGASFSFTISILAGVLSIFGDIVGSLMMLFPIIEIFLHPGNKESDFLKFLVLIIVFICRFIFPISLQALEKHLLTHQQDNRNTILTIVPYSIFGGLQFGLGGIVLGPLISVFPFLMLEIREIYEKWSNAKSDKEKYKVIKKYSRR
jgi:hypothetical protein